MSLPTHIGAYSDCLDQYDKALNSKRGIRLEFDSYPVAKYFTMRMHQARSLQRDEARRLYERDHPMWGRSEYDGLQVRYPVQDTEGHWWVYIEPHNAKVVSVEEIE